MKPKLFFIILLSNLTLFLWSQHDPTDDTLYLYIQTPPYPNYNFRDYVKANFNVSIPFLAGLRGGTDSVKVRFRVLRYDGRIEEVEALNKLNYPTVAAEAVRVVRAMPNWQPAKDNGHLSNFISEVYIVFTVPINMNVNYAPSKSKNN